jgi:8-hydroxy-5-deazaflavin:NADPH oxidoreductase
MRIAVLGTGTVGRTIGTKLVELGHDVAMGSRSADNADAAAWVKSVGGGASSGTFTDAATDADLVVNATSGAGSVDALSTIDAAQLDGRVLVDIANPLAWDDTGASLFMSGTDSLAETIQRRFPSLKVVKALNTMTADVMVNPAMLPGMSNAFMAGDDEGAKETVRELLVSFGWHAEDIVDVGGVQGARGLESYLLFWLTMMQTLGTPAFNIRIVK